MITEADIEEIKLLEEKKLLFHGAARKLSEASEMLNKLYILPDQRTRLTKEQYAAIRAVRETNCKVLVQYLDLDAGRSK